MGLYIDDLLNFGAHVNICRKAGRKKSVLATLSVLNVECKLLLIYSSFLSVCVAIGHFCSRDKMRKMEKYYKRELFDTYTGFQLMLRGLR